MGNNVKVFGFGDAGDIVANHMYGLEAETVIESTLKEGVGGRLKNSLPDDNEARTHYPMATGCLDYFPNALAEVARLSYVATQQHHPGEPMHWDRSKSTEHRDKIMRHLVDSGKKDGKGQRHSAMVAWRALALLQEELEREEGYPMARAAS